MHDKMGFGKLLVGSVLTGVCGAVATAGFLLAEHVLKLLVWGHEESTPITWFAGSLPAALVAIAGFVVAGVLRLHWKMQAADPNFVDEMVAGHGNLIHSVKLAAIALATIVAGGSVGPEAPIATLGAGVGDATARRFNADDEARRDLTYAGIAGVFGPLASFPFAAPIIAMEAQAGERFGSYRRLIPGLVAATVGLVLLYPLIGTPFLRVYDVGGQQPLVSWWVLVAAVLGVVGAMIGLGVTAAVGVIGAIGSRISHPVARAATGGVIVGAIGWVLPVTLFSGRNELVSLVADEGIGVTTGFVAGAILLKIPAFAVSMRWGGFGGAIFPLLFIGSTLGVLTNMLIPSIPFVVAVTAMAGAVTVALVPLPLMVLILTIFLFDLGVEISALPSTAVLVSYIVVHESGLRKRLLQPDAPNPTQ